MLLVSVMLPQLVKANTPPNWEIGLAKLDGMFDGTLSKISSRLDLNDMTGSSNSVYDSIQNQIIIKVSWLPTISANSISLMEKSEAAALCLATVDMLRYRLMIRRDGTQIEASKWFKDHVQKGNYVSSLQEVFSNTPYSEKTLNEMTQFDINVLYRMDDQNTVGYLQCSSPLIEDKMSFKWPVKKKY